MNGSDGCLLLFMFATSSRYTDQQLDREFIEVLRETCYKLVERHEVSRPCWYMTKPSVAAYAANGGYLLHSGYSVHCLQATKQPSKHTRAWLSGYGVLRKSGKLFCCLVWRSVQRSAFAKAAGLYTQTPSNFWTG